MIINFGNYFRSIGQFQSSIDYQLTSQLQRWSVWNYLRRILILLMLKIQTLFLRKKKKTILKIKLDIFLNVTKIYSYAFQKLFEFVELSIRNLFFEYFVNLRKAY